METTNASGTADLVARIRAGDPQAEQELVVRYSRGVAVTLRRETSDGALVEDLYQETFSVALGKIRQGQLREPEKLSGFIASLARNLAIEHFRRSAQHKSLTEMEVARPIPSPLPSQYEQLLQKERARIVRQVIEEMPSERDRQILFRFYIAEEDKESICTNLGLTILHFHRVLFRARERYRAMYEKALSNQSA